MAYIDFVIAHKVTILNLTPHFFYKLILFLKKQTKKQLQLLRLRLIILGGDAFHAYRAKVWFDLDISKKASLYNMYGITEGTIHSTCKQVFSKDVDLHESNIGKALLDVDIAVVDDQGEMIRGDAMGELCLSGDAAVISYLNDKVLNDSPSIFFFSKEVGSGLKRWFKTGDLVRRNSDGELIYYGRKAGFSKIRGFRIDLKQIENFLLAFPGVDDAVVLILGDISDEEKEFVAFIQTKNKLLDVKKLRQTAAEKLPDFMVPAKFLLVEEIPLTANLKVDKAALGVVAKSQRYDEASSVMNRNRDTLEKTVMDIWKQVLNKKELDVSENFFDAGGDSLSLLRLHYALEAKLNKKIELMDLINYASIEAFVKGYRESGKIK